MGWWPFGRKNKEKPSSALQSTHQTTKPDCPYCPDAVTPPSYGENFDAYHAAKDKIDTLIEQEKYKAALDRIEKFLPEAIPLDHEVLSSDISVCFEGLCDEKKPQAVLDFFNKLCAEGQALPFAIKHGQMEDLADAFTRNLGNYPEIKTKAALKKAIDFVMQDHPLLNELRESGGIDLQDFLDDAATEVFGDDVWKHREIETLPELIAGIEEVAGGGKQ